MGGEFVPCGNKFTVKGLFYLSQMSYSRDPWSCGSRLGVRIGYACAHVYTQHVYVVYDVLFHNIGSEVMESVLALHTSVFNLSQILFK